MTSTFLFRYIFVTTLFVFLIIDPKVSSESIKPDKNYYNRAINILNTGKNISKRYGHNKLKPIHILSAISNNNYGAKLLKENDINIPNLKEYIDTALEQTRSGIPLENKTKVTYSEETAEIIALAESYAKKYGNLKVDAEHLLGAIATDNLVSEIFDELFITEMTIKNLLQYKLNKHGNTKGKKSEDLYIDKIGTNLNEKVRNGKIQAIYGRDEEIRAIIESLIRINKNSPVLVGSPGTGKTTIIEGLAYRIEKNDVPKELQGHTIISLNFRKFTSGTSYRGEFESRLTKIIKDLKNKKNKLILFVDEIHLLIGAGKVEGSADAANLLKPVLSKAEIKIIGATTITEYTKFIESCSAFERRFEKILVEPPSVETTIKILRSLKSKYENFYGVNISNKAIISAVKISDRYIKNRYLPDKAIDLLNKACSYLKIQLSGKPRIIDITEREISRLSYEIGTLEMDFDKLSRKKYNNLTQELNEKKKELKNYYKEYINTKETYRKKKKAEKKFNDLKEEIQNYINSNMEPPLELQRNFENARNEYLDIYKEVLSYVEEKSHNAMNVDSIYQEHINYIYLRDSGMPYGSLGFDSAKGVLKLYSSLAKIIIGNEDTIKSLCDAIARAVTDLKDPEKPIGTFLFLGPTGVGKTELAKTLAMQLFNSNDHLIRVNMSEFTEAHSVSKIIGSPPGYIGFNDSCHLTESVRKRPHSVILFDELEKAHSDVFKVLLQILGDGYLYDSHARYIDFSNTIVIMTSNLGSDLFKKKLFFDSDKLHTAEYKKIMGGVKNAIVNKCKKFFKPEFVNRIDKISVFEPLNKKKLHKIVRIKFKKLEKRLEQYNIQIGISDEAVGYIIDQSYDPELGARPTLIFIESVIMTKFAIMLVKKELESDMSTFIDYNKIKKNMVINVSRD